MKSILIITSIGITLQLAFQMNDLQWIIEPTYDEIIVYGENTFVAKENGTYKVLDFEENLLYAFTDPEITGISDHSNEGGELQELIHVKYQGNKTKLFNIKSLEFIHENKYYLLQTEGYYDLERRLIRVFDELKEGVMDFDGNMILPPIYKGVIVENDYKVGFKENEILIFNFENDLLQKLPYQYKGTEYIKKRKLFRVQKQIQGEPNVYKEERVFENGVRKVEYKKTGERRMVSGIVDINDQVIIPFVYSSIYVKSKDYLQVTQGEKITSKGSAIPYFNPKVGIVNFSNQEILPIEYKYIGVIEGVFVQVENFDKKRAVFNLENKKFETDFIFDTYEAAAQRISELDKSNDFVKYKEDGLVGMKNKQGDILIPAQYRLISPTMTPEVFHIYGASEDEYGYEGYFHIGLKKEIVPTLYADRGGIGGHKRNNQNNVIAVMNPESGAIGFYKIDGTKISDTIFDEYVDGFSEDLAPVSGDFSDKTGMIDINGDMVYDYIFDSMTLPYDGKSIVSYKEKFGILKLK